MKPDELLAQIADRIEAFRLFRPFDDAETIAERDACVKELRALAASCGSGVADGWQLTPIGGVCPTCGYAYRSHACSMTHDAAPPPPAATPTKTPDVVFELRDILVAASNEIAEGKRDRAQEYIGEALRHLNDFRVGSAATPNCSESPDDECVTALIQHHEAWIANARESDFADAVTFHERCLATIKQLVSKQQRSESSWPECSGDPASCPENEGYGCCKPKAQAGEDTERWREVARRYDASKTSDAVAVLRGLGLDETPYRSLAENIDAARAASRAEGGDA